MPIFTDSVQFNKVVLSGVLQIVQMLQAKRFQRGESLLNCVPYNVELYASVMVGDDIQHSLHLIPCHSVRRSGAKFRGKLHAELADLQKIEAD